MVVCSFEDANVSENTLQFIIQVVVKLEKVHREWRKITFNVKHPDFIMFTLFHLFCSGIATQDCSSHKLSQFVSERFKSILNILENNPPRQIAVSSLSHTVAKLRESSLLCTEDSLPNLSLNLGGPLLSRTSNLVWSDILSYLVKMFDERVSSAMEGLNILRKTFHV